MDDVDDDILLDDGDEMAISIGCDPYLCHYLRVGKIVKKVNKIVTKIKTKAAGIGSDGGVK